MADPVFGEGAVVEVDDGAASAFVAFEDVTGVDPPDTAIVEVERNRLSVTTMVERAFSSRKDPSDFTITYEHGHDKYARVEALKGVSHAYRLTLADGTRQAFTGVLKANKIQAVAGGAITSASATVRATTLLTITEETPP